MNTNNLLNNLVPNENDEVEFPNYLSACKYNNNEGVYSSKFIK